MMGLLGLLGWKVTISSNFIALMLILTMAMNIHGVQDIYNLKKFSEIKQNKLIFMTTENGLAYIYMFNNYLCFFS